MTNEEQKPAAIQPQKSELPLVPDYVAAEVFLENSGFFTPASKIIKGIFTKEKQLGEKTTGDGVKKLIKVTISANHERGLPITSDLDYYRAFLKVCDDLHDGSGQFQLPIKVGSKHIATLAGKSWGKKTQHEVREWFERMTLTGIKGAVYRAKNKNFEDGFVGTVFSQVILRGKPLKGGNLADTNYVWPAPWWLSNYYYRYVRPIDLNFYRQLRKPIAKALYSLLEVGWYAAGGKSYAKTYRDVCAEFLLTEHRYEAQIRQQLDPAHQELKKLHFLKEWNYSRSADDSTFVITYYPGDKFFHDQAAREGRRQVAQQIDQKFKQRIEKKPKAESPYLIHEIIRITGDQHSTPYFRKVIQELPEGTLWTILSETKQAALEGRVKTTAAQYFTDLAERELAKVKAAANQISIFPPSNKSKS